MTATDEPSPTTTPLVVEVTRGAHLESVHTVVAVVVDTSGEILHRWGEPSSAVFPRSAVKPIQALPLLESGAADAFGLDRVELALACASHNGEPGHVAAVRRWLARIDASEDDLECAVQQGRTATPAANNCSGKHVGFLTIARHLGVETSGYIEPDHPVQRLVTAALAETIDVPLEPDTAGIDGCGIPAFRVPLAALAVAVARFGSGHPAWSPPRRAAARRLVEAMVTEPWMVAGSDRLCTDLTVDGRGELVVKVGAEGVQVVALPRRGLGIALKVLDGATRASEIALGHVLGVVEGQDRTAVFGARRDIRNHAGRLVGRVSVRSGP